MSNATHQERQPDIPPCAILREMLATRQVLLPNGQTKATTSGLGQDHAWALYSTVQNHTPKLVVEIGMAQGMSTLSILCALDGHGGKLISIDPYIDWPSGMKAAIYAVERAGYASLHTHIRSKSYEALPILLADGTRIDLGYIDGNHAFEHAFIDFFYIDKLLNVGGIIAFNDAGWPPVHRVIRYLQKNRAYEEIDVGLKPDYRGRNIFLTLARILLRRPRQDRYFRKLDTVDV